MWQKIRKDKRYLGLGVLLLVLAIIPITLGLTQQQQDIRQHASGPTSCSVNNPIDAMLLIDKSGSMGPPVSKDDRIDPAKAAAKNFVNILNQNGLNTKLGQRSQVGIVSFAQLLTSTQGKTTLDAPLTRLSGPADVDSVNSKIDAIKVFGRTCTQCAVQLANQEIASHGRSGVKKVVVLLTDGGANAYGNVLTADQVTAEAAANTEIDKGHAQSGTIFFTIGLGTDVHTSFLQNIASRTGGQYYFAPTAADLDQIYQQISTVVGKGTISGNVYNDVNKNKVQDTTESGLAGWKVNVVDPTTQAVIASTTTDNQGNYSLSGICDGNYHLTIDVQPNWQLTTPTNPDYIATTISNSNSVSNQNFGVSQKPTGTSLTCAPTSVVLTNTAQQLSITLKDSNGVALSGKTISWSGNTSSQLSATTSKTGTDGIASTSISTSPSVKAGFTDTITANYGGDSSSAASTCSVQATFTPQATTLLTTIFLHGIGNSGDNANPSVFTLSNKNPLHQSIPVHLQIYSTNQPNTLVVDKTATATYIASVGNYQVAIQLDDPFTTGQYSVFISTDKYLTRRISQVQTITAHDNKILPPVTLVAGDVDNNNTLNILDYDLIIGCYSDFAPPISCNQTQKNGTDITDDGKVDQSDYNLFLRELSVQNGDSIDQTNNP